MAPHALYATTWSISNPYVTCQNRCVSQARDQGYIQESRVYVMWDGLGMHLASQFFRLRLWTWKELLEQLFEQYDRLDEYLMADLPLKRVWMLAAQDEV